MEHRDSAGNQGVIGPGGVQWMTAGRGIIHSEMPIVTKGDLHGFQVRLASCGEEAGSLRWSREGRGSGPPF